MKPKTQKPIFTVFNRRITKSFFEIDPDISPNGQLHGTKLFSEDRAELNVLDDFQHSLSSSCEADQKINNKVGRLSNIRLSCDSYNFGVVFIDTFDEYYLNIINETEVSYTLEEIYGLPANGFNLCHTPVLPVTIFPKKSQFLRVLFKPEVEGTKTAILSLVVANHQRCTLKVILTGTGTKAYFLEGESLQFRGFEKGSGWANLGRGEVCPCCRIGEVVRAAPYLWMRLIPRAGHFACRKCGARFLTMYRWGKVLGQGQYIRR